MPPYYVWYMIALVLVFWVGIWQGRQRFALGVEHGRKEVEQELDALLQHLRERPDGFGAAIWTRMLASAATDLEPVDLEAKWETIDENDRRLIVRAALAMLMITMLDRLDRRGARPVLHQGDR